MKNTHSLTSGNRGLLNYGTLKINKVKISPLRKAINIIFDVICIILVLAAELLFFSIITSRSQNTPPSFAGYSVMRVSSGSMKASGFEVGDNIAIQRVKTDTLKRGDKIAFLVNEKTYKTFKDNINLAKKIDDKDIKPLERDKNLFSFFGMYPSSMVNVAKDKSDLVFHEIIDIYEDRNGVRYFSTKGTSNYSADSWYIREDLVVGIYAPGKAPQAIAEALGVIMYNPKYMMAVVMIPIVLIVLMVAKNSLAEFSLAYTEDRILYGGKRLQTPKNIENGVGMALCDKEKILLLSKTTEADKLSTLHFIWREDKPASFQKYYLRRKLQLYSYEKEEAVRSKCSAMRRNGVPADEIAQFYMVECMKIRSHQQKINRGVAKIERYSPPPKTRWRWRSKYSVAIEISKEQFKLNSKHNREQLKNISRVKATSKHTVKEEFRYGKFKSNMHLKTPKPAKHLRELMERSDSVGAARRS